MVCASALSFVDGKICVIQVIHYYYYYYYCLLLLCGPVRNEVSKQMQGCRRVVYMTMLCLLYET